MKSVSEIPVLILCGGLGSRLGELSKTTPKCLVEIHGRSFLEHQLDWLQEQGTRQVVLCVGRHGEQVFRKFGHHYRKLELLYSYEGEEPVGKTEALLNALHWVQYVGEFFILNGDTYLFGVELSDLSNKLQSVPEAVGVMLVVPQSFGGGNLYVRGEIVDYATAAAAPGLTHKDAGLVLTKRPFISVRDFPIGWVEANKVLALITPNGRFVDMGTPEGILELEKQLKNKTT